MIDLFGLADGALGAVNPMQNVTLKYAQGTVKNADFSASPQFGEITVSADIQALATSDLSQVQNINQQSDQRVAYVRGVYHALNRPLQIRGDIIVFDGSDWLVTQVLEQWGANDWCKILITRQVD